MKIKYISLIVVSLFFAVSAFCQSQIYFENFETSPTSFTLNDTIPGHDYGNNMWIVNNVYAGAIGHPTTINEDSTFGGNISYAPFGHYLHIYDSASGFLNANYNPHDSSIRIAHMTTGICTKALFKINFNFFYLCQGSTTAYGEVVYSIDGGPWRHDSTRLRYDSTYKWRYQTITNTAFNNVEDLRFGFLWHNNDTTGTDTTSMGVDDASIYGTYDSINHPITCTFTTQSTDSCLGGSAYIWVSALFSDSTCGSDWDFDVSTGNGSFSPPMVAYTYSISPSYGNDIYDNFLYASIPSNFAAPGRCFKVRLNRLTYPYLTFFDSVCFPLDTCPGTITTLQPPPSLDTNAICAGSIIDIPFFSTGIYSIYNVYFAQLIDSIGNTVKIDTIGNLVSNVAYPYPPGDVVSTIPLTVPAGCHYYVRIVCNTGNRQSTLWGPFCIQHCDIYSDSNLGAPLLACLGPCDKQPKGWSDSIVYDVHKFDSLAHYYPGNKFKIQLIQFMNYPASFAAINTGLFGSVVDTTSGKIYIHVPCPDTLFAQNPPINPGVYYIRVIADSSSFPDSSLGTLVHLTIGEPSDSLYLTILSPGPYCTGQTITVYTNPDHGGAPYNSTYSWTITDKRNGSYTFPNYPYSVLNFYNNAADTVIISCVENNNGCLSNAGVLNDTIVILGKPIVTKTGPLNVCISDTGTYSIPFANNTNYIWTLPPKVHADTSNNVLKIKFDSVGTFTIKVLAINACFTDSARFTVNVVADPVPVITPNPGGPYCAGAAVKLTASGATTYKWNNGKTKDTMTVTPTTANGTYWVAGSNKGCTVYDTINLTVIPLPIVAVNPSISSVCYGYPDTLRASGAHTYSWAPDSGFVSLTDSTIVAIVTAGQTYTVTGTGAGGCKDTTSASVGILLSTGTISTAEAIRQGANVTLTAGGGSHYLWSPDTALSCDTCENTIATPSVTTTYTVSITDADGCRVSDTVTIDVIPTCGIFVPNVFTPDNPNKINSILYVRSECLVNMDFIIYDRWGNQVFESKDLNIGWDGTYKGQPMNGATFVYYVTGTTTGGKTLNQKGNVALVR